MCCRYPDNLVNPVNKHFGADVRNRRLEAAGRFPSRLESAQKKPPMERTRSIGG